jgi:hypothetical protein
MPEKEYQCLTRARSRSAFGAVSVSRSSLWLGKDHLLCIDSSGYTETYKRFYFRDIQAVTIVATNRRTVWNGVLLVPIVICLVGLATSLFSLPRKDGAVIVTWVIFTAVFAVPLLINNILGPTCNCHLRTAVQIEELPSLSRVRRARKVLDRVHPFIIAVQGGLSPEEIPSRMRSAAGSFADPAPAPGGAALQPPAGDNPNAPPVIS